MIQRYQPSALLFCSAAGKIVKFGSFQPAKENMCLNLEDFQNNPWTNSKWNYILPPFWNYWEVKRKIYLGLINCCIGVKMAIKPRYKSFSEYKEWRGLFQSYHDNRFTDLHHCFISISPENGNRLRFSGGMEIEHCPEVG